MRDRSIIEKQLPFTLNSIDLPNLGPKIEGKVRDSYVLGNRRILITSDRLSAFDRVLTTIPFKGELLNRMASYWFKETAHVIENHILEEPHPNVFISRQVEILPVEVVIRGYLTGSAWRDYQAGKAISGIALAKGLKNSEQFETPLLTPSTKAERGKHDEPISSEEIVKTGIVEKKLWQEVSEKALQLFAVGTKKALERGLILVDTKYEFGTYQDSSGKTRLILADEIHTQDSSRYWIANSYRERFETGQDPEMLDKEFVRRWLIERGYMGDGTPPQIPDSFRVDAAIKYIDACERITGKPFSGQVGSLAPQIQAAIAARI